MLLKVTITLVYYEKALITLVKMVYLNNLAFATVGIFNPSLIFVAGAYPSGNQCGTSLTLPVNIRLEQM
jgi:hypothetical protein